MSNKVKRGAKNVYSYLKNPKYALFSGADLVARGYNRLADVGITSFKKGGLIKKRKGRQIKK
tara:strand:- start:193 stop:378 length:186 start_codon:yes stop_codon:yes gene_type:complete